MYRRKIKAIIFVSLLLCFSVNLYAECESENNKNPELLKNREVEPAYFDSHVLRMHVSVFGNVPSYWFEEGAWRKGEDGSEISGGQKEVVSRYQFNFIKRVHYFCYKNTNPLDENYYTEENKEFLSRFYFFRFTGKTMIPWVDVYLFALDLKTGLLFSYALPSRFDKVWGHYVPRDWQTLESHEYVKEHFDGTMFYEFDPVGYIGEDGKVTMYDWISKQNALKGKPILNYIPHLDDYENVASKAGPGYSPYRKEK